MLAMERPAKKWTSNRLQTKKSDLGIIDSDEKTDTSKDDKVTKKVNRTQHEKVGSNNSSKNSSKDGSIKNVRNNRKTDTYQKNNYDKKPGNYQKNNSDRRPDNHRVFDRNKKKYVIKMSNLPRDITVRELSSLVSVWGEIGNINIKEYPDSASSYVDFYNKEEYEYFIEALHSTPFGNLIIHVELMNFS